MRLIVFSIFAAFIVTLSCSHDRGIENVPVDEGLISKISVANDTVSAGTKFSVEVYIENNEPLSGIVVPLEYQGENITLDSISFNGTRFEEYDLSGTLIDSDSKRMAFYIYSAGSEVIDTGRGTACNLYFWIWGNAPTQDIIIDSVSIDQSLRMSFMDTTYNGSFIPDFAPGFLHVNGMIDKAGNPGE